MVEETFIRVRGARENNLKGLSLDIPKGRITVFTGVSGSAKSSLVFGTIAAESERLINETYPAFVQQFLPRYGQPDVDLLENISAAIIVHQQRLGGNARSSVATVTETADAARALFTVSRTAVWAARRLQHERRARDVSGVRGYGTGRFAGHGSGD